MISSPTSMPARAAAPPQAAAVTPKACAVGANANAEARGRFAARRAFDAEPRVFQRTIHVDFARAADERIEQIAERNAGSLLENALHSVFGNGFAALAEIFPQKQEHRVERGASLRARADLEIEDQVHELAFSVIAHRAVRRVLVGTIELDPGIERRGFERVNEPPRRRVEIRELAMAR